MCQLRKKQPQKHLKIENNININNNALENQKITTDDVIKPWGRYYNGQDNFTVLLSALLLFSSPFLVIYFWGSCEKYNCSLLAPLIDLAKAKNFFLWTINFIPKPTLSGFTILGFWLCLQAIFYTFLPSKIAHGQVTPAGYLLPYKVNGLNAWILTHFLFGVCCYFGVISPSIIYDNWEGLLVAANFYGYFLTLFAYLKANLFPSHPEDRKFSGSFLYDLFMGIELNPRIRNFDFKLFHNGRPGILAWTLINLSFLFAQYKIHGFVSNSMILVNFLQFLYVIDFFINEDWYLRTIDIAHDHFGFYLAWGDSVWLPFMYTLQSHYLVHHPIDLHPFYFLVVIGLGIFGYYIFRTVNHQKDLVRKSKGMCSIWGKPAKYIEAKYKSTDNTKHTSLLLCSGYWGVSRHFNYVGDLCLSLSMCLSCGFNHLLPYFYIIFMSILLLHRIERDHQRCDGKYGKYWQEYCQVVPYKLIPFVY